MTYRISRLFARRPFFTVPLQNNSELIQAKLAAFTRQVPMMYVIVILNTISLAVTFQGRAPYLMIVELPAALGIVCLFRLAAWWRSRGRVLHVDEALDKLRGTIIFAGILGVAFCAWSLSLLPYGDELTRAHVAFFMAITAIGSAFCLMHLRAAALIVMSAVAVPFAIYFGTSGNPVFIAIAFNFVVVTVVVGIMLIKNHGEFEHRVNSEKALRIKQSELQTLSDDNFSHANTDSLTGLPNRRSSFVELEKMIAQAKHDQVRLSLGILDLDGFKSINNVHGYAVGDRLLKAVGERLRTYLPPCVFLARLDGDEFVVFSTDLPDKDALDDGARRLIAQFDAPFEIGDLSIRISCSIGNVQFPDAGKNAESLFEHASYALHFAKQTGRGKIVSFSAEHEATIYEASRIDQALINADLDQELWIAYQPIVSATTGLPVSFEALARWNSAELGHVPPMTFILAAERSGMIAQLTPMLLRKALQGALHWPEHIRISFNLSAVDVASPLAILKLIAVVQQSGIKPNRIDFEVTETSVMDNLVQASESLNALRALGARISLDDFGTGYSSLSSIRELPLDKVKIDRSFISRIDTDPAARLILNTMIELSNGLGHDCIVEGVETTDQADYLRRQNCRFMQGYLFAKPMRGDEVAGYLSRNAERLRIAALCSG